MSMEPCQVPQAMQTWTPSHSLWAAVIILAVEDASMQHGWLKGGGGCPRCEAWAWLGSAGFAEVASVLMLTVEGEALDPIATVSALRRRFGGPGVHPALAGRTRRGERQASGRRRAVAVA